MTTTPRGNLGVCPNHHRRRKLLFVLALAQLALDAFIVNVALLTVQRDLHRRSRIGGRELCAGAGLLPLGGRVADSLGTRRAMLVVTFAGRERGSAFGIFEIVGAIGTAIGSMGLGRHYAAGHNCVAASEGRPT